MRILAIDTALAACSAAVFDTQHAAILASDTLAVSRGHAELLMPVVAEVMSRAATRFTELDRIAVTVGPGSFTGLRVGIAAARGISLAAAKPAIGVSTLAALAAPLIARDDSIPVLAVIDARNQQVYAQMFGRGGRTLIAAQACSLAQLGQILANERPRIIGSAAAQVAAVWPAGTAPNEVQHCTAPQIECVARLGASAEQEGPPKPLYLKAPNVAEHSGALARR